MTMCRVITHLVAIVLLTLILSPVSAQAQTIEVTLLRFVYEPDAQIPLRYELPRQNERNIPPHQMRYLTERDLLELQGYEVVFGNPVNADILEVLRRQNGIMRKVTNVVIEAGTGNLQFYGKTESVGPNDYGVLGGIYVRF